MSIEFRHRATHQFWNHYDKLPKKIAILADTNFELLKLNSKHPSLHFKKLKNDLWSVRIGLDFRALALKDNVGFTWIWIGSHAEYDKLHK